MDKKIFALFLLLFFIGTFKYISTGETYSFSTQLSDNKVDISGNIVSQDIIIDSKAMWNNKSYAVYFTCGKQEGYLKLELSQNGSIVDSYKLPVTWLKTGFNELKWLDFAKLQSGNATVTIEGDVPAESVYIHLCENDYNIPNSYINNDDTRQTLVQSYHYNYFNMGYVLGIVLFVLLVVLNLISLRLCDMEKPKTLHLGVLRINIILNYMILVYIYDSSLYFAPTWAEAVTNYMDRAVNQSFAMNILSADAGYLPLLQRIIADICFQLLGFSPYTGLFILQWCAYFITGWVFSFFLKPQFSEVLNIKFRYMISIILMVLTIKKDTGAFINFISYGILIIFLYFLVDSNKWSKAEFAFLCIWGLILCLSKGYFVTILPFFIICLLLLYRCYSKRDKIFMFMCSAGALVQLIYYLTAGGRNWVDRTGSAGGESYYLKLLLEFLKDTPNALLAVFSDKINFFNGISLPLVLVFWGLIIYFGGKIIIKIYRKEPVDRYAYLTLMMLFYIMIQSAFLKITIYAVNTNDIISDDFWQFKNNGIDNRYQVLIFMSTAVCFIACLALINKLRGGKAELQAFIVMLVCIFIANPRLQLKGIGNDNYSAEKSRMTSMTTEAFLLKDIDRTECRVIPIQPDSWIYGKNATCYCFGTNIFAWEGAKRVKAEGIKGGNLDLREYSEINNETEIWQIFIKKRNLINNSDYQLFLYDDSENVLLKKVQDNTKYQEITSFTLEKPIDHVSYIQILDNEGNPVYIENGIYVVTNDK